MRILLLFSMMLTGACQTAPKPAAPATQTWEEFVRDHPDTFVATREADLAAQRWQLEQAGLAADYLAIRTQVDTHFPPRNYTLHATGAAAAIIRRQEVDSTTVFLVRTGYRARHLDHQAQARTIVRAAASGWGDADALALVSPVVLVADLDRIDRRADNSADLVYRITERIKSAPPLGSEIRLSLNGPMQIGTPPPGVPQPPPPPPNPGMSELSGHKRVVLFLRVPETIIRPAVVPVLKQETTLFGPMPVDGERVRPGYHSTTQETTLTALRAAVRAQLCSPGYVPLVNTGGPSERC